MKEEKLELLKLKHDRLIKRSNSWFYLGILGFYTLFNLRANGSANDSISTVLIISLMIFIASYWFNKRATNIEDEFEEAIS